MKVAVSTERHVVSRCETHHKYALVGVGVVLGERYAPPSRFP